MNDATVNFLHYEAELADDVLSRLGSRYFNKKEAGKQLRKWLLRRVRSPLHRAELTFSRSQLACANEVFPEAALADPVADLEVWDEWRTGLRRFPYPGVYTRLDILRQGAKTSATSSVGVLGEILAGLFSQSFVSPLVVVRPIRRWPDFIFLAMDQRYSFVESKASATLEPDHPFDLEHVKEELLGEGLIDAVQELNAEPFLRIWLSFSDVTSVQPLVMNVCVLELHAPHSRLASRTHRVPDAVVDGLAERLLVSTAADLEPQFEDLFARVADESEKEARKELWQRLKTHARERADEMVALVVPEGMEAVAADAIRQKLGGLRRPRKLSMKSLEGKRLTDAKRAAAEGLLTPLRRAWGTDEWLMLADLPPEELAALRSGWRPDWEQANRPWGSSDELALWRCSSAVVGLGSQRHGGMNVREVTRDARQGWA